MYSHCHKVSIFIFGSRIPLHILLLMKSWHGTLAIRHLPVVVVRCGLQAPMGRFHKLPCLQVTPRRCQDMCPSTFSCRTPRQRQTTDGTALPPTSSQWSIRSAATMTCPERAGTDFHRGQRASRHGHCPPAAMAGLTLHLLPR